MQLPRTRQYSAPHLELHTIINNDRIFATICHHPTTGRPCTIIAQIFRDLQPDELSYPTADIEFLTTVWAATALLPHFIGHTITIFSDLELNHNPDMPPSGRRQRWRSTLGTIGYYSHVILQRRHQSSSGNHHHN